MTIDAKFVANSAAVVWLSGQDRLDYLQRMSTARLVDLDVGQGRPTAILTDIGRVVDLVTCYAGPDGAALITSAPVAAEPVAAHLRHYVLYGDKVRVTNAADQVSVLRLLGADALAVAADVVEAAAGLDLDLGACPPGGWLTVGEGDDAVWMLRHASPPAGLNGGVDVIVSAGERTVAMAERLCAAGAAEIGADGAEYAAARIGARMPMYGAEIDGQANPLELGLKDLVDFAKGCYIGQEVVARLDTYEKVQRRLVSFWATEPMAVGDAVLPPHEVERQAVGRRGVGRITSAAADEFGSGWVAMALVPSAWPVGAGMRVETEQGVVGAELHADRDMAFLG